MTNHYVATVPVKFTDNDGQERTRFQRVGAMFPPSAKDPQE
jgi:hypothetical protein